MPIAGYIRSSTRFLPCLLICLQFYCSSGTEPQEQPVLKGIISDQQGDPVSGAMIEVEFYLADGGVYVPKAQQPLINSMIRFSIPEPGPVRVWITRYGETETVRVLMNEVAMAGNYMLIWDGKNEAGQRVINHIYQSHVLYNGEDTTNNIFVTHDYYGEVDPDSLEYYTLSDAAGNFTITAEKLACTQGVEIEVTDELGNKLGTVKLSREVRVWALHHAHGKIVSEKLIFKTDGPTNTQLHY